MLQSMEKPNIFRQLLFISSALTIILMGLACSTLDNIGERPQATNTFQAPRTATFGGRISVWMSSPTAFADGSNGDADAGQLIGPVGTATAISRIQSAQTQTAQAPVSAPNFVSGDCPEAGGRLFGPAPSDFDDYPAAIGTFLSNGGSPIVLESELNTQRAINRQGGVIQADTDLTGDRVPEIIVNIFNPNLYNADATLNAGQMLVYGCDNGGYRLLYRTPNSPGLALPILHRVGDMNGDARAELVFDVQSCSTTGCTREGYILSWNPITGIFEDLNNQPIISVNGRLGVVDLDDDGILELTSASNPTSDISSGPRRSVVDIWDWTGENYILAIRQESAAQYRIHTLHDADQNLRQQAFQSALTDYRAVRNDDTLLPWTAVPNDSQVVRAFATYRMITIYARLGDGRANTFLNTILTENPVGTGGEVYAAMAQAFMEGYRNNANSVSLGCQSAIAVASSRPEALSNLNAYGYANPSYTIADMCPF